MSRSSTIKSSVVRVPGRETLGRCIARPCGQSRDVCALRMNAVEEWDQHGLLHKFVNLRNRGIQCFRGWRMGCRPEAQDWVTHRGRQIDLTRAIRLNVSLNQTLPQRSNVVLVFFRWNSAFRYSRHHLRIVLLVSAGVHGKFQCLQTMVA